MNEPTKSIWKKCCSDPLGYVLLFIAIAFTYSYALLLFGFEPRWNLAPGHAAIIVGIGFAAATVLLTRLIRRRRLGLLGYVLLFIVITVISICTSLFFEVAPDWDMGFGKTAVIVGMSFAAAIILFSLFIRWLCNWRNLRRFLLAVACLVAVLAALVAEENGRGHRAWDNYRRAMEAKGETFSLSKLAPPPVPDDQNLACAPLLKTIYDFDPTNRFSWSSSDDEPFQRRDTNAYAHLEGISANLIMSCGTNYFGARLGDLAKGTFTDLAAWRDFYRGNTNYPQSAAPGTPAADVLFALGKFDADVAELHEAAAIRPYTRFPIAYDCEPAGDPLVVHYSTIRRLATLMDLRATAELELGRSAEAFTEVKLAFRFSNSMRGEPLLISHFVRLAILSLNLQTVREGLVRHAWTDAQLTDMDRDLASVNLLAEWKLSMRGRRADSVNNIDYIRRTSSDPYSYPIQSGPVRKMLNNIWSGFFYQSMVAISEMQEKIMLSVDENAHRVLPEINIKVENEIQHLRQHPLRHYYQIFAAMEAPALLNVSSRTARMQSSVDEARVAIALERYRLANGHLPDALSELAPQFIDKIPTDVMDGEPLRYRKTGEDNFILYSIGWNQKDDGGTLGRKPITGFLDTQSGDWVWFSSTNHFDKQ